MKAWKIGAIVGGVYAVVAPIIGVLVAAASERAPLSKIAIIILSVSLLPMFTYKTLHAALDVPYTALDISRGFVVNIVVWILIGSIIGLLYEKWRGRK